MRTGYKYVSISAQVAALILLAGCGGNSEQGEFSLKGKFSNTNGETLYLEKLVNPQPVVVDSVTVDENGEFEFENYSPRIGFYRVKVNAQNFAMLVLDSSDKVTITGDVRDLGNSYKTEGSEETALFTAYNDIVRRRETRLDSLNKVWQMAMETRKMDSRRMDSLSKVFEEPYNQIVEASDKELIAKVENNLDRYASLMAIQAVDPDKNAELYRKLDATLIKKFPEDRNVRMFHDMVVKVLAMGIGQSAPELRLPTPEGKELALSSLRGKYVLVDFWASWCGPCRKEMPYVVAAYKKHRDKGFEIYGVSLDDDRDKWLAAIKDDGMTWPQVSDLKQFGSEAARIYNIQAIPYAILLDREGKIVAKNLRGEELDRKLSELLQ